MIKEKILTPFQKFVNIESFSGILLFAASIIALVWANSAYSDTYIALWDYKLGIKTEQFQLYKPLILWINDGLMAVFFFLIGLEVKREIMLGELNSLKKLAFPLTGALGGILFPVLFYYLFNQNSDAAAGWGIPMATDIAFALAIIKLLGNKVPLSLKVFLTAFAIVDDIGAVLVIALFYSGQIQLNFLIISLVLLVMVYILSYKGLYSKYLTFLVAVVVWFLFLKAGIHPTLAGVLMAFSIPIRQGATTPEFVNKLWEITHKIKNAHIDKSPLLTKEQLGYVDDLEDWVGHYQSPLQKLENRLHDWVAYLIMPVFALANAGVIIGGDQHMDVALAGVIVLALVLGKSIGISLTVFLANRIGLISIPDDINRYHIIGISFIAGVGFTMSIFIAGLAFSGSPIYIDSAKVGILIGSTIAGIIGYLILRFMASSSNVEAA